MKQVSAKPYSKSTPNIDLSYTYSSYTKPSFLKEEKEESDGLVISDVDDDIVRAGNDDEENMADDDSFGLSGIMAFFLIITTLNM